jgi:GNAT superfamily N-acetyltransferase
MAIAIRGFKEGDARDLVSILRLNGQFGHPEVEGPEAMKKVAQCQAAVFLVAETDRGQVTGCIKAVYDGSRALIHLLSVHPDHQRTGIGTALFQAAATELAARGAPTASVIVNDQSATFWTNLGFTRLPAFLMLRSLDPPEKMGT